MQPFNLKYQPQNLLEVKGQDTPLAKLRDYVLNYKKQKKKAVLIYGGIGCGKTSSVHALAKQFDMEIIEINSSDIRNEEAIKSVVGSALQQRSLFFRNKLVLIDEIDGLFGREDRGGVQAIQELVKESTYPIVMTANDPFDKKLALLRKNSEMIEFNQLKYSTIANHLKEVCAKEKISFDEKTLLSLARMADGDMRGALTDLQILAYDGKLNSERLESLSDRKKTGTIFNALQLIFKASEAKNSLYALDELDIPMNEIFLWLDENLPKEYTQPEDLCLAYDRLSKADVFNGRIHRQQYWRFLVYINNYLTAGISSSKTCKNPAFIQYARTTRILKLWQAKMKHAKKKDVVAKIAEKTFSSQKEVLKNLDYFRMIFKNSDKINQQRFSKQFDFSLEEEGWLRR